MTFQSINPYNQKEIGSFSPTKNMEEVVSTSASAFSSWRNESFEKRAELLLLLGENLTRRKEECAKMITAEMGKPISESLAEIEKCVLVCTYYAENAVHFLKDECIESDATLSFVQHSPLGCVLAVMPWNFPFWQVFRFAAPTVMAGNVGLLKHASNVSGCGQLIAELFQEAEFPKGVFQTVLIDHKELEKLIMNPTIKAVTLTGSEGAGKSVSATAGGVLKKSLLELGGSNAFIVLEDADIDLAVEVGVNARMLNAGQSCISAKRILLVEDIYDAFLEKFIAKVKALKVGNPMENDTKIGPLARLDLADKIAQQVKDSIQQGAKLMCGGKQEGCFYSPTVLTDVTPEMTVFKAETFGPVAVIIKARDFKHAIELSEQSDFGLGVSVFSKNTANVLAHTHLFSDGAVFINELVKSDPRLPFGGTKLSGYGRELGKDGILEFVNRKTIYVK